MIPPPPQRNPVADRQYPMNREGPLAHPRLRSVEAALDAGRLEDAQILLGDLGQSPELEPGTSFLALRLLFLRGRLDIPSVTQRLRDLLREGSPFAEAERMLHQAEQGTLERAEPLPPSSSRLPHTTQLSSSRPGIPVLASERPGHWTGQRPLPEINCNTKTEGAAAGGVARTAEHTFGNLELEAPQVPQHIELRQSSAPHHQPGQPLGQPAVSRPQHTQPVREAALGSSQGTHTHSIRLRSIQEPAALTPEVARREVQLLSGPPTDSPFPEIEAPVEAAPEATDSIGGSVTPSHSSLPSPSVDRAPVVQQQQGTNSGARRDMPPIPRAPGVPRFTPPPDLSPSYSPARRIDKPAAPIRGVPIGQAGRLGEARGAKPEAAARVVSKAPRAAAPDPSLVPDLATQPPRESHDGGRKAVPVGSTKAWVENARAAAWAGRYTGSPVEEEVVWKTGLSRRGSDGSPDSSPAGAAPRVTPRVDGRALGEAAPEETASPTLFEVVSLLDEGRFELAIRALDHAGRSPEEDLLRARALSGLGRQTEARGALEELCSTRPLDPELRAGAARLLLELGAIERALVESRFAMDQAPDPPLVRLTVAWAAVRLARRTQSASLITTATTILEGLRTRGGPHPALVLALRACIHAHGGENDRAIAVAQRALALDPRSPDAWAALAVASAKLGRHQDAGQALLRLKDNAAREAQALEPQLTRLGVSDSPPDQRHLMDLTRQEDAEATWDPLELALIRGDGASTLSAFERECRERLRQLAERDQDESFEVIGNLAASFLARCPVFAHFAPFDFSLYSLPRIEAALEILYPPQQIVRDDADDFPSLVLLGSYLGEVVARATGGEWAGSVLQLNEVAIVGPGGLMYPFQELTDRMRNGRHLRLIAPSPSGSLLGADAASLASQTVLEPTLPESLWGPATWPRVDDVPRLGRALCRSVPSLWCARNGGGPLDGTPNSVIALERYLDLMSPPKSRHAKTPAWAPRLAVLAGGYIGEVLRLCLGGSWTNPRSVVLNAESYRLSIRNAEITPIAQVYARLTGRDDESLRSYVHRLLP